MLDFLTTFWDQIAADPIPFIALAITLAVTAFGIGYQVAKAIDKGTITTLRERLSASQDDVMRLREELPSGDDPPTTRAAVPETTDSENHLTLETGVPTVLDEADGEPDEDDDVFLDEEEEESLKLIADSHDLAPDQIAHVLDIHYEKGKYLCERLRKAGYLKSWTDGSRYELTQKGREYLVDNDLL